MIQYFTLMFTGALPKIPSAISPRISSKVSKRTFLKNPSERPQWPQTKCPKHFFYNPSEHFPGVFPRNYSEFFPMTISGIPTRIVSIIPSEIPQRALPGYSLLEEIIRLASRIPLLNLSNISSKKFRRFFPITRSGMSPRI